MKEFISGVVVGLIVATVGFSGVVKILDSGVAEIKKHSTQLLK